MAWWSALALLPDADVVGFSFGVRYADPWGHRGATHSIAFALAVATAIAVAATWLRPSRVRLKRVRLKPDTTSLRTTSLRTTSLRTWLIASAVLVSHGLLDTMTDGGRG